MGEASRIANGNVHGQCAQELPFRMRMLRLFTSELPSCTLRLSLFDQKPFPIPSCSVASSMRSVVSQISPRCQLGQIRVAKLALGAPQVATYIERGAYFSQSSARTSLTALIVSSASSSTDYSGYHNLGRRNRSYLLSSSLACAQATRLRMKFG